MERALDLGLLTAALAGRTGIPDAEELQQLMADVEVQLFLRRAEIPQELLDAAWYLHAVASVNQARQRYTAERQRQAFQVSAHIFDLALNQDGHPLAGPALVRVRRRHRLPARWPGPERNRDHEPAAGRHRHRITGAGPHRLAGPGSRPGIPGL